MNKSKYNLNNIYVYIYIYIMDKYIDKIKENRDIKQSSLNQYISSFKSLNKALENKNYDLDFFKDTEKVLNYLNGFKLTTQKNKLTSLIVFLNAYEDIYKEELKIYRNKLIELNETYNNEIKEQKLSTKQSANWIDYYDIIKVIKDLKRKMLIMKINKKEKLDKRSRNILQKYTFLILFLEFPYRNHFHNIKVISDIDYKKIEDKNLGNWIILKNKKPIKIILNDHKSHKKHGMIQVEIPNKIANVLKLHLKHNESEYLFNTINNNLEPYTSNSLTKYVQSLFREYYPDKNIGTQILRTIIITHYNKNNQSIKEKEEINEEINEEIKNKFLHTSKVNEMVYSKKEKD